VGWRSAFFIAGILGAAGVLIAWAALPRQDSGRGEKPQPLLDFRPVLANRNVLALTVGYAAAIWGCVGLRQWIVVFLTFRAGDLAADPAQAWIILAVGAVSLQRHHKKDPLARISHRVFCQPRGLLQRCRKAKVGLGRRRHIVFVFSPHAYAWIRGKFNDDSRYRCEWAFENVRGNGCSRSPTV
jgi:hypothetical protein